MICCYWSSSIYLHKNMRIYFKLGFDFHARMCMFSCTYVFVRMCTCLYVCTYVCLYICMRRQVVYFNLAIQIVEIEPIIIQARTFVRTLHFNCIWPYVVVLYSYIYFNVFSYFLVFFNPWIQSSLSFLLK